MTAVPPPAVEDPKGRERARYSAFTIVLHWLIAALIFAQIALGWWFNEVLPDHSPAQRSLEGIHISLGLTTLVLVAIRIITRFAIPVPELPRDFARWESLLARTVHVLFYFLMLAMPLTGWLLVTVRGAPIHFWGLNWPALPGFGAVTGRAHRAFGGEVKHIHVYILIWIACFMVALHVAGAIKHQFDGHPVLWRILPGRRRP